jgi:hypothetical protein
MHAIFNILTSLLHGSTQRLSPVFDSIFDSPVGIAPKASSKRRSAPWGKQETDSRSDQGAGQCAEKENGRGERSISVVPWVLHDLIVGHDGPPCFIVLRGAWVRTVWGDS